MRQESLQEALKRIQGILKNFIISVLQHVLGSNLNFGEGVQVEKITFFFA